MQVTLGELAVQFGCTLRGSPDAVVTHVATLESADSSALSFLANPKYKVHLATTRAGAVVLDAASANDCPVPALIAKQPYVTYARIAAILHPPATVAAGAHASAVVASSAVIDNTADVGACVVIGEESKIDENVVVGPGCVIGKNVVIGRDTRLMPNVTVLDGTVIGSRCVINSGAVLGSEGFGFAPSAEGWVKVPQVGRVIIGDDVEIGANTTIDRGAIGDTMIGNGVKLDNQIQIAHNVQIGDHTAIAACTGISGSTSIGKNCMIAGQVGIAGHLSICDNVVVTGKTMVSASIRKPGVYSGSLHAEEARTFRRNAARFAQLDELAKLIKRAGRNSEEADNKPQDSSSD
jgi:UDP-3-O-[3-hydroxymyristoyl] glucosamine N-acyltransferase